jgi:hypothetical protein
MLNDRNGHHMQFLQVIVVTEVGEEGNIYERRIMEKRLCRQILSSADVSNGRVFHTPSQD